jgi:hypothetical protein
MIAPPYTYFVAWSDNDGAWVGICAEFPGLSHVSGDDGAAMLGIQRLVDDAVADMLPTGEAVPTPRAA